MRVALPIQTSKKIYNIKCFTLGKRKSDGPREQMKAVKRPHPRLWTTCLKTQKESS